MKLDITLLEVSFEFANKIGGIYTVIASKVSRTMKSVSQYCAIGPYIESNAQAEFEPGNPPEKMKRVFDSIHRKHGITCYYGRWVVGDKPETILVDPAGFRGKTNSIKKELWHEHRIDSLHSDAWFNDPLIWSRAAGIVIDELVKAGVFRKKVIAHFHEWLSGAGLLYLKSRKTPVKTVFTTHSTVFGRTVAETGREDLYGMIEQGIKSNKTLPDSKAAEYGVQAKHSMEKASALNSDVFTTVSETVARECTFILGRKPDLILPNGLDMAKFPLMEDLSDMHINYRNHIRLFVMSYFSPYYEIDAEDTLFYFISGRYEIRNKGIDVFIDALGSLNERLKKLKTSKQVVAFIWVPAYVKDRKPTVMEHLALFETMEGMVEKESKKIEGRIISMFAEGKMPTKSGVFDKDFLYDMKKMELQFKKNRGKNPPLTPFELEDNNAVIKMLEKRGLLNRKEDKVKVIYYPAYLSRVDGLLSMNYYDAIIGCHLGVFPSYYESWGYTPLETAALGLSSVTTDLAGFGRFIKGQLNEGDMSISILHRDGKSNEDVVRELEDVMLRMYRSTKKERIQWKARAKQLSTLGDWSFLIKNYIKAYELALKKQ